MTWFGEMGTTLAIMAAIYWCVDKRIGVTIALVAAIYAANKPYPMDYDANGELLVDGVKMANDTFKAVGWLSAFLVGWILEKRYVGFSTEIPMSERLYRLVCGLLGYYIISLVINPLLKAALVGFANRLLPTLHSSAIS